MTPQNEIPKSGAKVTWQDNGCFVCGPKNPLGLHLEFDLDYKNNRAVSIVVFKENHQGWDGVVHGGILAAVLDDVMVYAIMTTGSLAITTRMSTTYRKPVLIGETLFLEGTVEKIGRRTAIAHGSAYTIEGEGGESSTTRIVKVESEGIYFLDKPKEAFAK